jgi:hypothetical protein
MLYRYRLSEQRFELLIEQRPVRLTLYMDVRRRVWIEWNSQSGAGRACIGQSPGFSIWLDHEIELSGRQCDFRILVKKFPDGYMISNYGRGFDMKVLQNTFCL